MSEHEVLTGHRAYVAGDNSWQRRTRLMQSLWRQRGGLAAGLHRGVELGSRLREADGLAPHLMNFLSEAARDQVQRAVREASCTGALLSRPRLWVDLLSSQPLCFNVFGPLAADHSLATSALRLLWPDRIKRVLDVRFEWSPGRGDERYTGNRSAFDVFIDYEGPAGRGFLGIEVKYHEDLTGSPANDEHGRYPRLAGRHGVFRDDALQELQRLPLQQIWLDHLLALQLRAVDAHTWDEGTFVFLYPVGNVACARAAARYRRCLTDTGTFEPCTLDAVIQAIRLTSGDSWAEDLYDRYLDTARLTVAGMPPSAV
jgi:hypothetical protein